MAIRTQCPHCSAMFRVSEQAVGRKAKCKRCEQPFTVTEAAQPDSAPVQVRAGSSPAREPPEAPVEGMVSPSTMKPPEPNPSEDEEGAVDFRVIAEAERADRMAERMMECPYCAEYIEANAKKCHFCGERVDVHDTTLDPLPVATPPPQVPQVPSVAVRKSGKSRVAYILLGLFMGGLGIHNFYAGYSGKGLAQLLLSLFGILLLGIPNLAVGIWVIVEVCTVKQDATGQAFS